MVKDGLSKDKDTKEKEKVEAIVEDSEIQNTTVVREISDKQKIKRQDKVGGFRSS
jgi:hypothetical protein